MGSGPFAVRRKHARALLSNPNAFSGLREIWLRDVYLKSDFLRIEDGARVVDLGANMGVFTLLALAHGPGVSVLSVEPSKSLNAAFAEHMALNGWQNRATLERAFLGGRGATQEELLRQDDFACAAFISQEDLIARHGLTEIDFLKCDIEGSEFELLHEESPLLAITQQLAIEVHDFMGDRWSFLRRLERCGFELGPIRHSPGDCVALARRV